MLYEVITVSHSHGGQYLLWIAGGDFADAALRAGPLFNRQRCQKFDCAAIQEGRTIEDRWKN